MSPAELFIDRWYPVLRGGPPPVASFDLRDRQGAEAVREAWARLGPGERILIRTPGSAAARSRLARLGALLEASDSAESFLEFGAGRRVVTLLPADDGAAFRGSLDLLPHDLPGGRALAALLRLASPFKLAHRFGRPEISVWTRLGHALPALDLPVIPVDGQVAVQVTKADSDQPVTVRAMDRRGDARVALQVGVSPASAASVLRGSAALAFLREAALEHRSLAFASGEREGCPWLASNATAPTSTAPGAGFEAQHAALLLDLLGHGTASAPLGEIEAFVDARRQLDSLWRDHDPQWHDDYSGLARALQHSAAGAAVDTGPAHGDLSPETIRPEAGTPHADDWGRFTRQAPLLYDLFHFLTQLPGPGQAPSDEASAAEPPSIESVWDSLRQSLSGVAFDVVAASGLSNGALALHLGLTVLLDGTAAEMRARLGKETGARPGLQRSLRQELARRCREVLDGERRGPWPRDDEHLRAA